MAIFQSNLLNDRRVVVLVANGMVVSKTGLKSMEISHFPIESAIWWGVNHPFSDTAG